MRFPLNTVVNYRSCGDCQACCTTLGIKELDKPTRTRCPNQGDGCCTIYEDRPPTCRGYECLWRLGILEGDERRRPDNLGVIFDFRSEKETIRSIGDVQCIQATEVWPGAFRQTNIDWLLRQLATRFPVVVQPY